jgi:hypothetical protein
MEGKYNMATQINNINDISTLLRIPTKVSNELVDKACLCIGSSISEAKHRGDSQIAINIGIGILSVNLIDMQCKFVPGKNLKTSIKSALNTQIDPLELELEKTFADKLLAICEEVI